MSDTENTADTEEGDANVFDQEDVSISKSNIPISNRKSIYPLTQTCLLVSCMLFFKFSFQITAEKFRKKTDRESVTSEQDAAAIAEAGEDDDVFDEAKPAALEEKQEDAESGGNFYIT